MYVSFIFNGEYIITLYYSVYIWIYFLNFEIFDVKVIGPHIVVNYAFIILAHDQTPIY
jgi:hypothetical protein